jgi:thiol-disulfide isomerase/thioredoxin
MPSSSALRRLTFVLALLACASVHAREHLVAGDIAPTFVGTNREFEPVSLESYVGKVVVISLWASWCPPCLKEMPILDGIQRSVGQRQIQVIAINTETPDVYRQVAKRLAEFDLMMTHDTGKKASDAYGVNGIPHMVIIGRDGRIVRVNRGYNEQGLDAIVADINRALVAK